MYLVEVIVSEDGKAEIWQLLENGNSLHRYFD